MSRVAFRYLNDTFVSLKLVLIAHRLVEESLLVVEEEAKLAHRNNSAIYPIAETGYPDVPP
jgi:hypothetical protein